MFTEFDLQLFAEDVNPEPEPVPELEPDSTLEPEPESEPELTLEPKPEPEPAPRKEDTIPLPKYVAEKKRRQELEKILAQQTAEREKYQIIQEMMSRGWPEAEANYQASERIRQRQELDELRARQHDLDIKDLARSDPFFADAEAYRDEIRDKMRELNLPADQAYMLLRGTSRFKEVQTVQEQKAILKRRETETKKVETAAPRPLATPYKLDNDDKKALAGLQEAQPEAGWTVEKYHKLMKET